MWFLRQEGNSSSYRGYFARSAWGCLFCYSAMGVLNRFSFWKSVWLLCSRCNSYGQSHGFCPCLGSADRCCSWLARCACAPATRSLTGKAELPIVLSRQILQSKRRQTAFRVHSYFSAQQVCFYSCLSTLRLLEASGLSVLHHLVS